MKSLNFLLLFLFISTYCISQNSTLNLYVLNESGEAVISAYVLIDGKSNFATNQYGYLSANLSNGKHKIILQHISYKRKEIIVELKKDTSITIRLEANEIETIEISASGPSKISFLEDISLAEFKEIPAITGEPDVIANLSLLPGVSTANEGNVGFSVRGGETYQNSILIDRSLLLNPSHLFGLLSTVNSKVVNEVKLYKNHIPSRFGNASASVVDIIVKDGNKDSIKTDFNIGITNSGIAINGPISPKLTFLVDARSAYLGLLTSPAYFLFKNNSIPNYTNYNFYDGNLKLRYDFSPSNRITFHVYRSRDNLLAKSNIEEVDFSSFNYFWQSNAFNISQYKQFKSGYFWNNYISYSNYGTELQNEIENIIEGESNFISNGRISAFNTVSFQSQISKSVGEKHLLRGGFYGENMNFTPVILRFQENETSSEFSPLEFDIQTFSAFVDNDFLINPNLKLNYGFRFVNYFSGQTHFSNLEPRISLKYDIDDNRFLEGSYNRLSQNRIQFPLLNFGLPLDIIIPVFENILPPITDQLSLSFVQNNLFTDKLNLVTSIYYKNLSRLTTIERLVPIVNNFDENFQDHLAFDGIGVAYGLELSLNYSTAKNDLSINYHLSRSLRRYEEINRGEWFPHEFDRLHELNIIYSRTFGRHWSFYCNLAVFSGAPVTLPTGILEVEEDIFFFTFQERNNFRLSPFHRLNLSIVRKLKHKKGRPYNLSLSLYNAYNSRNPFDANLIREQGSQEFRVNELAVFPIIPSLNYSTSF